MLVRWVALYICGSLVLIAMGYVVVHVVGRYLFNFPVPGTYEWVGISLVPIAYLALGYGLEVEGTYVAAKFLLVRMKGKLRYAMEIFIDLCLLAFACVLGYGSFFGFTGTLWALRHQETYGTWGVFTIITWPFKLAVVVGFLLMAIGIVLELIQIIKGQKIDIEQA